MKAGKRISALLLAAMMTAGTALPAMAEEAAAPRQHPNIFSCLSEME